MGKARPRHSVKLVIAISKPSFARHAISLTCHQTPLRASPEQQQLVTYRPAGTSHVKGHVVLHSSSQRSTICDLSTRSYNTS
jgi:hypothetical protein